ncbi:MAG: alpha-hydroxy acid oxidase [Paracoccus sp. (in: a-proteobacteria)]|uniref:alpha-hydroxy acid oxidase n=1 Tax=Paracoccus sp. TaxID=267 RepID=UPI0026DFF5F2|nr:alpha-hydroxy acid oxidase [Paracoccus sp. (in: a-proteobacteria)]MDO5622499.1 alpha-hydroxy acid oxidase [Paracoccus sp. (in: a-proteobacteria)]
MSNLEQLLNRFRQQAEAVLDPETRAYFFGTAGRGMTAAGNRAGLDALALRPRVLADMAGASTRITLLGQALDHPILIAPFAHHAALHPQAEAATAAAVTAQGGRMVLSAQASLPLEQVAAAGAGCDWFQLYWIGAEATLALAHRAAAAGFRALMLTVDAPVRAGAGLVGAVMPNLPDMPAPVGGVFAMMQQAPRWQDLEWLCRTAPLPVLVKGILHPDDARWAEAAGVAGIVVSNHGGRVLDGVIPAVRALPGVRAATTLPLLLDGGIRSGADVLRALALGADAVMIARPVACALAADGAMGVARLIRALRDDLEISMALTGCADLRAVDQGLIAGPGDDLSHFCHNTK